MPGANGSGIPPWFNSDFVPGEEPVETLQELYIEEPIPEPDVYYSEPDVYYPEPEIYNEPEPPGSYDYSLPPVEE